MHPQSIIHSAVQFEDGSVKAQMGLPDMKLPIQYALGFPKRIKSNFERFSFFDYPNLTFEKPNLDVFKNLKLAFFAMEKGGNMNAIVYVLNLSSLHWYVSQTFEDVDDALLKQLEAYQEEYQGQVRVEYI